MQAIQQCNTPSAGPEKDAIQDHIDKSETDVYTQFMANLKAHV